MDYGGNTINVVLLDNAMGVPGSVWHNDDDSYAIFIDASLSVEHQRQDFGYTIHDTTTCYKPRKIKAFVMSIATRQHSAIQFLPLFCPFG